MTDPVLKLTITESPDQKATLTFNDIATKLLNDKFLLTALEFHTELIESGRESKQLKEFFSNPSNFEQHLQPDFPASIPRSGSQATLDSLDLTRFSEDGERGVDERVAVLEFELRKAKETISALRANLTVATESETNVPETGSPKHFNNEFIKPHEQRALNFLINEYLLSHEYKLTSITFADENENQDFEDWQDVGLDIPKPAELLAVYREGLRQAGHDSQSVACQADIPLIDAAKEQQIDNLNLIIEKLKQDLNELEKSKIDLQNKYDSLLSHSVQYTSDNTGSHSELENHSSKSLSPENFEVIEQPHKSRASIVTLDDDGSALSLNEHDADWTSVVLPLDTQDGLATDNVNTESEDRHSGRSDTALVEDKEHNRSFRKLPADFQRELLSQCFINVLPEAETESVTPEWFVRVVSRALPRIVPSVILNKREEAIPLLVGSVRLTPSGAERDLLLQQLFNLKKRPSEEERRMILSGLVGIAKSAGESLVENEVLPQCWEQLTHKHVERRLLVAESCSALTPYVSSTIRNSLMLSMLQQLLEDREAAVREMAVRALALVIARCADPGKYPQCEELVMAALGDPAPVVSTCTANILIPVLAQWALEIGKLHSSLVKYILHKLNQLVKLNQPESPTQDDQFCDESLIQVISVLNSLLPFLLVYVAAVEPVMDRIHDELTMEINTDITKLCSTLTNPRYFYNGSKDIGMIMNEFDKYISEESCEDWPELSWFIDIVVPDLLNTLNHMDMSRRASLQAMMDLFSNIRAVLGAGFTSARMQPLFHRHVQHLEHMLLSFGQCAPNFPLIPVYLASVLPAGEVCTALRRLVCALPLCGAPPACLELAVAGLCGGGAGRGAAVVDALWDGVVHQRALVRGATAALFAGVVATAPEALLCSRIAPALVTLASDPDILVRTATLPALGSLITDCSVKEVHDKAYMQLQSFLSDPSSRDNHAMLRQLVVTLGHVLSRCQPWFREEVILPQLAATCAFTAQMSNQTRRVDMASALLDSFSAAICCPLNRHTISTALLPGLKYLETMDTQSSDFQKDTISAMIRETENRLDQSSQVHSDKFVSVSQMEDVRQRVSKIFNSKSASNISNLQGMFRKK